MGEQWMARFAPQTFFASGLFSLAMEEGDDPVFHGPVCHDPEAEALSAPVRACFAGKADLAADAAQEAVEA
jgi:hypothetical protein